MTAIVPGRCSDIEPAELCGLPQNFCTATSLVLMTYSGLPHAQTLSLKQACAYVQLNCHQGLASHSTAVKARRKRAVLAISWSRRSVDSFSIWSASSDAPTTAGATWGMQYIMK